jgi:hypothetical protein
MTVNVQADVAVVDNSTNPNNSWGVPLYDYVNQQFGKEYTSSNAMYAEIGVQDLTETWNATGTWSMLSAAQGAVGFDYNLRVVQNGETVGTISGIGLGGSASGLTPWNGSLPDGISGEVGFVLDVLYKNNLIYSWSSDASQNAAVDPGNPVHMIALNVTDLYNGTYGTPYESVYMFAWEDLHADGFKQWEYNIAPYQWWERDNDYQDVVFFMANVRPGSEAATPEPATLAVLGLGLAGLGLTRIRRRK